MDIPDEYVLGCAYRDTDRAGVLTRKLLGLKEPPTCIMYPDDFTSLGGVNAIKEAGLSIPDDISIAGYDGISYAEVMQPALTTLAQDCERLGSLAAIKLIDLIERL